MRYAIVFAALLLAAAPAAAQSVRVTVADAASGAALAEALVRVETPDGVARASGFTNAEGAVTLRVREGVYRVRVERAGYHAVTREGVSARRGEEAGVALRLDRRPIGIDTVTVVARSGDERGRDGFERRRRMGEGVFLDSAYLDPRSMVVPFVGDLLRGVPGIYVTRGENPVPRSEHGWGCMVMLLDGRPLQLVFADGGTRELHHVIGPRDVKAAEVYRTFDEVPPEFRRHAQRGGGNCGVYLYWTRAGW